MATFKIMTTATVYKIQRFPFNFKLYIHTFIRHKDSNKKQTDTFYTLSVLWC